MKQIVKIVVLLFVLGGQLLDAVCLNSCDCEHISKSHLAIRPHFQSASPEMLSAFRYDRFHAREDGLHMGLQCAAYGSRTTNESELARYFMPFCKTQLVVAESGVIVDGGDLSDDFGAVVPLIQADLSSEHFNIHTHDNNFQSIISFCPQQSVFGFAIHGRTSFWRNDERENGYWVSVSIPIERVKNNIGLHEEIISDGGGADETADEHVANNMREAFNQTEWNHCKIPCGDLTETGIADIELKLGYEWLTQDPCHLESYIGFLLPAGKKGDKCFMWAPQIGHGDHFGLLFGGSFSKEIWRNEDGDKNVRMAIDTHTQYLFSKTHCRCFDLKCKPWSRFIELYASEDQAQQADALGLTELAGTLATPGVNILGGLSAKVTPGFSHNATAAFIYESNRFSAEFGYNLYCRQDECVKLACDYQENAAIKAFDGQGQTNPIRDITGSPQTNSSDFSIELDDYEASIIFQDEIDLASAAAAGGISHTLYGSFGWHWDEHERPFFINIGGSYEKGKASNGLVDRWTVWAKAGWSL